MSRWHTEARRARHSGLLAAALLACAAALPAAAQNAAAPAVAAAAPAAAAAPPGQFSREALTSLPSTEDLRPTGPITITANHAEAMHGNSATYTGNVVVDSNTLKMDGDRLELQRADDGQYQAKLYGAPAHVAHTSSRPDDPQVFAHAKTINYDSRSGVIDLIGEAYFKRGNDVTTSDTIRYNVASQSYEGNGRVTIVIPPTPALPGTAPSAAPAPAAPGAPAVPAPSTPSAPPGAAHS